MSIQKSDAVLEAFTVKVEKDHKKKETDETTFRVSSTKDREGREIINVEWTYQLGQQSLSNDDLYKLMLLMDHLKGEGYHLKLANP